MRIRADVKCHSCGFVSGEIVGSVNAATKRIIPEALTPSPSNQVHPWPVVGEPMRCARCNGKTYLDDIEMVREKPAVEDRPRKMAA